MSLDPQAESLQSALQAAVLAGWRSAANSDPSTPNQTTTGPVAVAYSGGVDSTALLHTMTKLGLPVQAVHVNHQLQDVAADWPAHCRRVCAMLGVPLTVLTVHVDRSDGTGLEAQARAARYSAIGQWMLNSGITQLWLGHHRDDQVETVLLQLLRGSGLKGIAGMPPVGPWPSAQYSHQLIRPLLQWSKEDLRTCVALAGLPCVDDPSNSDVSLRRNWLREVMLPQLRSQFPQTDHAVLRLGEHFQEFFAQRDATQGPLLDQLLDQQGRLKLAAWQMLEELLQRDILHTWLGQHGIRCGRDALIELHRQLTHTDKGGVRQVKAGWAVRVHRGWVSVVTQE